MTSREITAVALKFFGIYLLVTVIIYVPSMVTTLSAVSRFQDENFERNTYIIVVGSFVLLGAFVSFVIFKLANSIASQLSSESSNSSISQQFLLQLLGVYFLVNALSVLPGYGISITRDGALESSEFVYGLGYIFQLVVAAYLIVSPSTWKNWLNFLRGRN